MSQLAQRSDAGAAPRQLSRAKLIIAASLGNGLEMFDFTVFSFFASIIGALYFPSETPYGSLLMAVGVFGVGFVMRPLGSMVLGAYADRAGRKAAMLLTITLMGLGTAMIALAPTHAQIGIFAPLLILAGRLLQGFSAGGEIGASTALLMESAGSHNRGFYVSWQVISQGTSSLLGAACGALLTSTLSQEALHAWGWRLPFLVGLAIIPVGLYIRRKVEETYSGHEAQRHGGAAARNPVSIFLREHLRQFVLGLAIIMAATLLTYIILFYMPTYMTRVSHLSPTTAYLMSVLTSLMLIISALVAGLALDRLRQHKRLAIGSLLVAIVLVYPTFVLLADPATLWLAMISRLILVAAMGFNMTAGLLLIIEALPRPVRATGMAMTYALGVALFGGTAQFVVTWLLEVTGNPMSPAWYLIVMLLISLAAFATFRERHFD
ncbi:MFS transporter [Halotalea alkalilenta]|uniref:MFS transporter n=1 Tax=Halotalea alkalilenta TaxID=376489 RepID=A0A172YDA9_9GAMM|nr:MFS transporter [Halotalea alkalilenta]ANF57082.1 MFS transporter [Halotalea alkalilenta]